MTAWVLKKSSLFIAVAFCIAMSVVWLLAGDSFQLSPDSGRGSSGCVYVVTSGEGNTVNVESMSNQEEGTLGSMTPDPKNIKSASSIASVQEVLNKMAGTESGTKDGGAEKP